MRWVVHIGTQKTGSKAIQTFLASSSDQIPGVRLSFSPHGREGIWHEPIYWALRDGTAPDLDAAVSQTVPQDWDIVVFSCEAFHELSPKSVRIIRDKLGDAQIVLFIRNQADALNSLLNQYAKAHRVTFDDVVDFARNLTEYNPRFDYQATIVKWAEVFGMQAITPIIYDKRIDAVQLFCDAIGVTIPATYEIGSNPNRALTTSAYREFLSAKAAVSDSAELPALVERLHRDFRDEMIDTFRETGPLLFDAQARLRITGNYDASNEWVRARWFPSRTTLFEYPRAGSIGTDSSESWIGTLPGPLPSIESPPDMRSGRRNAREGSGAAAP
jgi:hypothetical protein